MLFYFSIYIGLSNTPPVYSENGDEGEDADEDADNVEDDPAGDVLEHGEAGEGDEDEDEDRVEDGPEAPHQHQRVLLLAGHFCFVLYNVNFKIEFYYFFCYWRF